MSVPMPSNWVEVVSHFQDRDGFVVVAPGSEVGGGNVLLHTGLFYVIKAQYGMLTEVDQDKILDLTERCMHTQAPLLWRSPYKQNPGDDQQHDDYYGWLAACYFAGNEYPEAFVDWMDRNAWIACIAVPGDYNLEYYFDRFFGFRAFAKMCARRKVTLREEIELALVIFWKGFRAKFKSDACMREFCAYSVARRESSLCRIASDFWRSRLEEKKGGIGQSFLGYFQGAAHPLTWINWSWS